MKTMSTQHNKLWGDKASHKTSYMKIHKEKYIQVY